jgi:hypothetical protein
MERRGEIKQTYPGIRFHEATKLIGQEWTDLESNKKQV